MEEETESGTNQAREEKCKHLRGCESSIRDVDFADEAANFSKMRILVQASSFALAQANASSQTVLSPLQG